MSNSITQKTKYKQSVVKFSYKYGVRKAAIKFNEWPKTIYRWRKRYDGKIFWNLEDLANRGKYWRKEYNNFPMRALGWLSPLEFYKNWKCQKESV